MNTNEDVGTTAADIHFQRGGNVTVLALQHFCASCKEAGNFEVGSLGHRLLIKEAHDQFSSDHPGTDKCLNTRIWLSSILGGLNEKGLSLFQGLYMRSTRISLYMNHSTTF